MRKFEMRFITLEERKQIENWIKSGISGREIARKLEKAMSCIHQEIKRNGGRDNYNAEKAQERHLSIWDGREHALTEEQINFIDEAIKKGLSLKQMRLETHLGLRKLKNYLKKIGQEKYVSSFQVYWKRLENVEQQVKILSYALKQIMKDE